MVAVSLCMIVRNEELALPRCLASVDGAVDEIVVVDTGSTDGTIAMARDHGARVLRHEGVAGGQLHFGHARNVGLDQARGRLVLVLDADETLHPAAAAVVRAVARSAHVDHDVGYVVTRRNLHPDGRGHAWTDHAVRLFPRRPEYRYRRRVHETVDEAILAAGGRLVVSDIELDHHLAADDVLRAKWAGYVDRLRADLLAEPDDVDRLHFLRADLYKLQRHHEAVDVAGRIAELCPDDFDARLQAALLNHLHGRDDAAAAPHLAAALALRPGDPEALALQLRLRPRDQLPASQLTAAPQRPTRPIPSRT